jgi:multidrug efflux system outer membrane protein
MSRQRTTFAALSLTSALLFPACTVGPNYQRPVATPLDAFRGPTAAAVSDKSFGDEAWASVFHDEALKGLMTAGLANNYDVRIAASRILQAEAQLGITRADQFPTINGQVTGQKTHGPVSGGESKTTGVAQVGGVLSWEIDFWGKYRRATESARAQLLASEWARRAVLTTLVGQIANGYFGLRALDAQLDISERTLTGREESLRLTRVREHGGATSMLDVRQAEQLVFAARGVIVDLRRRIEQQENAISVLVGRGPGPIERGLALISQAHAPEVPAGLPSALIERRPDIQQAEQLLIASNAQIGVAKAAYFPQVSLTAAGGVASSTLGSLFTTGAWAFGAALVQPIINSGRNRSKVAVAEERRREAELVYQQRVQQAFREVSDALVGYQSGREFRETQEALVAAAGDAHRLADVRYRGGATSYLEVLDTDSRVYTAELGLAQARLSELNSFVELYRSLGGGFQP